MVINPIVGVYIPIIRIPIKGRMTIPNIATFDRGTYEESIGAKRSEMQSMRHRGLRSFWWQTLCHNWSTNPPGPRTPPGINPYWRLMKTHWFPFIRPAIKPLFLRGVRWRGVGWLAIIVAYCTHWFPYLGPNPVRQESYQQAFWTSIRLLAGPSQYDRIKEEIGVRSWESTVPPPSYPPQ